RELWEETGIALEGGAAALQLFEVLSKRPGNRLVLFAVAPALELSALPPFVVNDEVSERRLIQGPTPLAFPLHTEVADRFFATLR
ncbi:MAG: NUDIX hydrolase, partial [Myxococcota bacterium]|nr:NUDIX hydrolase [Myxococcota bacterium]